MDAAKLQLSPEEEQLVQKADWILAKNTVLKKVNEALGRLQKEQSSWLQEHPAFLKEHPRALYPKISRGENYGGLPYLVLDYPRLFDKENVFAIRSFFWWGHFFSTTLHIAGSYQEQFREKIADGFQQLQQDAFFICTHTEQWEHHFEPSNYTALKNLTTAQFKTIVHEKPFTKISYKIAVNDWREAEKRMLTSFQCYIQLLGY